MGNKKGGYIDKFLKKADKAIQEGVKKADEVLEEAVELAENVTVSGGVVLLSPGAPSFGQFVDYRDRGRQFARFCGFEPEKINKAAGQG